MLNAVWVAVIIAAACWAVLVVAAVHVLIKLSRLITQTSATVSGLREDSDAVIARAHATIDATAGQLNRTDDITASMDQVAAGMAELTGRVTALAPLARLAAARRGPGSPASRRSCTAYGTPRNCGPRPAGGAQATARRPGPSCRAPGTAVMIRRLFWLILGAALGITGYRRVTAVARAIMPAPRVPGNWPGSPGMSVRAWTSTASARSRRHVLPRRAHRP